MGGTHAGQGAQEVAFTAPVMSEYCPALQLVQVTVPLLLA